ncbi:MAG: hypothetical protein JO323_14865 [Acidobacteriia bacterium]|nr:hypothetical protein [Terriglobia bacterium]
MGLLDQFTDILGRYSGGTGAPASEDALQHYQQVASQAPPSVLSEAIGSIFRTPETGTFGANVSSMFGRSDPNQRAGILNTLLASGGSGILSKLGLAPTTQVSPQQAQQVSPEAVEAAANHAQSQDPSIVDRASEYYAQHPQLVQALGAGAALIALQHFSKR